MAEEPKSTDPMIAALLREREGLVQAGLADRVAQVDEQLRQLGHRTPVPDGDAKAPASRSTPPKGRRTRARDST
ncbi:hypothetical protein [Streptomyces sp. NRRL F-5123]|uniref:hypothetical protein n=1 Tax=Streptomyces sp. NRRL F-5123 TaxID=1463856 RepID=UPI0004E254CF|nr:hypothetical protein [Streptomyces sp. NRRL F-5123]